MMATDETRDRKRRASNSAAGPPGDGWLVHGYTALGLVAAAGMAVLIVQGGPEAFRGAFLLMMVATLIDATDGTLARQVRVKEVLPGFDGSQLDNLIDFLTYTFLPLLLLWRAGDRVLPAGQEWWLLLPLVASALRLLPGIRQDQRRLLPRFPILLEPGGVLSVRTAAAGVAGGRHSGRVRRVDFCAVAVSLPDPARPAQLANQCPGRAMGLPARLHPVPTPGGLIAARSAGPRFGRDLAGVPGVLPARFLDGELAIVAKTAFAATCRILAGQPERRH